MAEKRQQDLPLVPAKRGRTDTEIVAADPRSKALVVGGPPRSSSLLAPVMMLSGHEGEIFTAKFSPNGSVIASAGQDRKIFLWNTYGECENFALLSGHTNAIMEVAWSHDNTQLYSASVDKSCAVWDAHVGERIRRFRGHTAFVNSVCAARLGDPLVVTGSDDCTVKVWDARRRNYLHTISTKYQVTATCFGGRDDTVIVGGLDNTVHVFDLRNLGEVITLAGHTDTVTGVRLSPDGTQLLTNGMDNTVRIWDVQPFSPTDRLLKVFHGAQHNFEKNLIRCAWSSDGRRVSSGSADRNVYVWDVGTQKLLYCLPGHKGSVNEVDFHPKEPVVLSASSDKRLFMGEIAA
eukprot:m.109942 g.109942  ORF g.109942 m.109942 type:complete len:348 (-) comp14323_c0_seq4:24-1067(-)